MQGKAFLVSGNGNRYIGTLLDGRFNGLASLYYADGTLKYTGEVLNSELNGRGRLLFDAIEFTGTLYRGLMLEGFIKRLSENDSEDHREFV